MDTTEIKKLIEETIRLGSETSTVEFKDARGGIPRDTWKTISAFSHRPNGGHIIFGIKEDRQNHTIEITGIDDLALLQEKISDLVSVQMSVVVRPQYFPLTMNNKTVLAVYIPECPDQFKPCYY